MSVSETVHNSDPRGRDRTLTKEVALCDPSIMRVILLDEEGEIKRVESGAGSPELDSLGPDELERLGAIDAILVGVTRKAPVDVGEPEYALYAFGDAKILLIGLTSAKRILAIRIQRSANTEYLYRKIHERFESR